MMNRDHGPSDLPSGGGAPSPMCYPRPTLSALDVKPKPLDADENNNEKSPTSTSPHAERSGPAPTVARTPLPGPLERAIAAAQHPGAAAAGQARPQAVQAVQSDMAAANAAAKTKAPTKPAAGAKKFSLPPSPPPSSKPRYKKRTKKYNNFNIFFMLERQLLLQSRGGGIDAVSKPIDTSDSPLTRYKDLHLPPLCRRYNHLPLTSNWFLELLANQNKKRPHRKSHGLIPFKELAQTVAQNYREIDDETQAFVNEVAERLGWHCEEAEAIEARERRHGEDAERSGGARGGCSGGHQGRKRKDAPVVSVAGKGAANDGVNDDAVAAPGRELSGDEAATVQQLMGMKTNSPPLHQAHPTLPQVHPMSHHPMNGADVESERLRLELARAMTARRDSEQRIRLLKEQMIRHDNARAQHRQHQHHHQQHQQDRAAFSPVFLRGMPSGNDRYLASLLASAGGSPPLSSRPRPTTGLGPTNRPGPQEAEKALLKETLARRLVSSGAALETLYPGAQAAPRGGSLSIPHPPSRSAAPLKKRQRISFDGGEEDAKAAKLSEEKEEEKQPSDQVPSEAPRQRSNSEGFFSAASRAAGENRPASAGQDDIGFYRDLYSELLGSGPRHTHPPPPNPHRHAPSPREAALLDLARTVAGPSGLGHVERALLESLASRAGGTGRNHGSHGAPPPAHYPPPPARYPPPPPPGPSYASLLSQLASSRGPPGPPPPHHPPRPSQPSYPEPPAHAGAPSGQSLLDMVHAASSRSQFGLSYGEIMDVWKEMHRNQEGSDAGQFGNDEDEGAGQHAGKE